MDGAINSHSASHMYWTLSITFLSPNVTLIPLLFGIYQPIPERSMPVLLPFQLKLMLFLTRQRSLLQNNMTHCEATFRPSLSSTLLPEPSCLCGANDTVARWPWRKNPMMTSSTSNLGQMLRTVVNGLS